MAMDKVPSNISNSFIRGLAGGSSSALSLSVCFPFDTIRNQMHVHVDAGGLVMTCRELLTQHGLGGLCSGIASILDGSVSVCLCLFSGL